MKNETGHLRRHKKKLKREEENVKYRYSVNLTAIENASFQTMFEQSGIQSKSQFIAARIFNQEFRVIKIDRSAIEYITKLTTLYGQFRAIGVNYNQVTVALKSNFTEKKALAMLYKLEQFTLELTTISHQVHELSKKFEEQWLPK